MDRGWRMLNRTVASLVFNGVQARMEMQLLLAVRDQKAERSIVENAYVVLSNCQIIADSGQTNTIFLVKDQRRWETCC